jgi:anti-sigma factor RsiW
MKKPKENCRRMGKLLNAYYDEELSPRAAEECTRHLRSCPRCRRLSRDYRAISRDLAGMAEEEREGREVSLWPGIRERLREESQAGRSFQSGRRFSLVLRPAWVGLGLSAAAALILFFSGVFTKERLPTNYCRIESISTPEHNLMIHRGQSDGLTIIWLSE